MEVARCILLLQLFLHLLSTYIYLPYLFLTHSFSCFLQLVSSISSLVSSVYVFHPLHLPLPSSKCLSQVISKYDHTTSHCLPLPVYVLLPSIPTCSSAPLYSSCIPTLHHTCPHHRSFCSSQNSHFIFSQTSCFASI